MKINIAIGILKQFPKIASCKRSKNSIKNSELSKSLKEIYKT